MPAASAAPIACPGSREALQPHYTQAGSVKAKSQKPMPREKPGK